MVDWTGTVVTTTTRLVLRTFREDDLPLYAALNADPAVVRHLGLTWRFASEHCGNGYATEAAFRLDGPRFRQSRTGPHHLNDRPTQ